MLLFLLACSGDCEDADCRQAEIVTLWETDAAAATQRIATLPSQVEKVAVITALTEAHPGQTMGLCNQLAGDAATRCKRLNLRPHLRAVPPPPTVSARPAPGPDSPNILPDTAPPFADVKPIPALSCEGNIEPKSCRAEAASAAAREGRARTAVGLCLGMPGEPVWQSECVFHAAEKLLSSGGLTRLPDASDMCLSAGDFAANCLAHLTRQVAADAPPAATTAPGPWTPMRAAADALSAHWEPRDATFAALSVDRLWADALSRSYARSAAIVGNPLDLLPESTRPHAHTAAALRLMATAETREGTLADWQAKLDEVLAARSERPAPPSEIALRADFTGFWPEDRPGEETIPAIFGPGNTRRPVSDDEATDRLLAVMEAAARTMPPYTALLTEAESHPDELVRWNARRLKEGLSAVEVR